MSYVQHIGWHNLAVPPSLQLVCPGGTHLFNVGEFSQRFRFEHRLSIGRICNILLTDASTSSVDGLIGFIFALEATAIEKLTVFGPPSTRTILQKINDFYLRPCNYEICAREIVEGEFIELISENGLTIYGSLHKGETTKEHLHIPDASNEAKVSYLLKCEDVTGPFRPEEAIRLGVKKGVAFGILKKGQAVQIEDGTWIQPNQVCDEPMKGKNVLILHDNAMESLQKVHKAIEMCDKLEYVFWMHTTHNYRGVPNILNGITVVQCDMTPQQAELFVALPKQYHRNLVLNSHAPQLYPTLCCKADLSTTADEHCDLKNCSSERMVGLPPLSKYMIHPPNKAQALEDTTLSRQLLQQPKGAYTNGVMPPIEQHLMGGPSITFLGTGCSAPSPMRNVSGMLVHLSDTFAMLLDAGEGTLQQIYLRCDTLGEFIRTICNIKVAFISHSHADHHLGLYSILAFRKKYARLNNDDTKMVVIAPKRLIEWMEFYNEHISPIDYVPVVSTSGMNYDMVDNSSTLHVDLFEVEHITDSLGIKITHNDTGSIVYSGDTRPCDSLIRAAMSCDILIQEATFHDDEHDHALQRCHTTFSEALKLADACKVGTLILTHFSQRYQTVGFNGIE